MIFLLLLIVPVLIAAGFFLFGGKKIVWQEFLIQVLVQSLAIGIMTGLMYWSNTSDTEIWNGVVVKKNSERVSCEHSYRCNCVQVCSGSGKDQSCQEICQTCYDHSYDIDWAYYTTDDGRNTIDRVDRQGIQEPSRWTRVVVGEPSASKHSYTNYIKAAEGTLFKSQGLVDKYKQYLPAYPSKIFDYYKTNRLVFVNGGNVDNGVRWNNLLSIVNGKLGAAKQVNIILVIVKDLPQEFFYALEQHWVGGKKNDFIVVVGTDQDQMIKWTTIMAWTNNEIVKIKTRDDLMALGSIKDVNSFMSIVQDNVNNYYVRKPMKDFAYLQASITPTTGQLVFCFIISVLLSIGLGWFFLANDFFEIQDVYGRPYQPQIRKYK